MSFIKSVINGTTHPFSLKTQLDPGQFFLKPTNTAGADAVAAQKLKDAQATAKAEADAANESNALRIAQKRAYQANALALGGFTDDSLGRPGGSAMPGAGSVLSQGASPGTRAAAASTTSGYTGGTALGAGASGGGSGGGGGSAGRPARLTMQR